jgi:hypothetical protein
MNRKAFILLLAGCCLLFVGCQREAAIPNDRFHLTVQRVISDTDVVVSVLKIRVPHGARISVEADGGHNMVAVPPDGAEGTAKEGQVALSASRFTLQGDNFAYVQTLIRSESSKHSFASLGPNVYTIPAATKLETYFSISATDGDFMQDTPVEIARLNGKPVMLVVGTPTK